MLRRGNLYISVNRNVRLYSSSYSVKSSDKAIGYQEKPNELEITADVIGPPDKKSNIRPILRHIPNNETQLQQRLRFRRIEVEAWVDKFWRNHNKRFFTEKEEFVARNKTAEDENVSADKMSEFYKAFLDKNWKMHVFFNISWYLKNFELLILSLQVHLQSNFNKLRGK